MGLLSFLLGLSEESKKEEKIKRKKALEKEMDVYGLSEDEKELVRKGEQDVWDFEEEDLEEDDYYYEDDK